MDDLTGTFVHKYLGRHAYRGRLELLALEVDRNWKIAVTLMGFEERITSLQMKKILKNNWQGKTLEIISQSTTKYVEGVLNKIIL